MAQGFQMRSTAAVAVAILLLLASEAASVPSSPLPQQDQTRKMLNSREYYRPEISTPDGCSMENVEVYQNDAPHQASGIPAYSVEVINSCVSCTVYDVHLSCGNFASTDLVDPAEFRRIAYDDCLVNDGKAMGPGDSVSFHYSNSFQYPLEVASVACNN
ncbi:TPD1 protein homolog 1B [Brachypodium distachyon]|uniref:Uncharacterized protein n=1 Tax=Brachypodium distachyon TaxID=15368 RepID=I1IMJ6_BRADI|nr:TPD1 protein homolog 1B [Brachypodium distachyon]KQJ88940.1 hypothetical protein BRADI_4g22190v3 [Brachypodium distachyon]|eukprot:XP_003577702.1 TPD1 protein homolog 1B [Brachypodium distachyon]